MKRDVFFGVFLTMFLLVFTPFGLSAFAYERFYIIVGYGAVCYITIVANDIAGYTLFPNVFSEKNWKVYNQILWSVWHFVFLGITNLTFGVAVGAFPLTFVSFLKIELYVLASAIIPVMGITLIRQNFLLNQNVQQANSINLDIEGTRSNASHPAPSEKTIRMLAENNKDSLEIRPSSLILISSQDNYVEFIYCKDGKVCKQLLRSTLSRIEEKLANHPDFFRCHRAFIIHLDKIKSVEGNSQGYRIQMENVPEPIPVARPKNRALKELIHRRSAKPSSAIA